MNDFTAVMLCFNMKNRFSIFFKTLYAKSVKYFSIRCIKAQVKSERTAQRLG